MNRDWFLNLWLMIGIKLGFVSPAYCATHDECNEENDPCHLAVSILISNPYQGNAKGWY